jgi:hypothetical protein
MKANQPTEPQPAPDCQCDLCRQLRQDAAAEAIIVLIGNSRRIFKQDGKDAGNQATGAAVGTAEDGKQFREPVTSPAAARKNCVPDPFYAPTFQEKTQFSKLSTNQDLKI